MPPSSLIFVVILAVWGAYLVQHWVRRRDHIATARSVDRFSEAMRVLERRQRLPQTDISRPVPRSYAVSPIRPASPEVVVKHATPPPAPPSRVTAARVAAGAAAGRAVAGGAGVGRAAGSRARAAASPLSSIRGRSAMLLVGTLAMVLGTVLGVLELWPWWTAAAGIGAFALACLMVRRSVRSVRSVRSAATRPVRKPRRKSAPGTSPQGKASASRPARVSAPRTAGGQGQRVATRPVPGTLSRPAARNAGRPGQLVPGQVPAAAGRSGRPGTRTAATAVGGAAAALAARNSAGQRAPHGQPAPHGAVASQRPAAAASQRDTAGVPREATAVARRQAASAVYDIDLVEGRAAEQSRVPDAPRRREGPAEAGSWDPVPVPPPTYTLKAKATPRHTDPQSVPGAGPAAQLATAAAGPHAEHGLPFDGLALAFDEESEELPAVRTQH